MTSPATTRHRRRALRAPGATHDHLLREGILKLLAIKDSDIRLLTLEQCRDAVDKSLHAGGAFSATIPLVTLYYGGFIDVDVTDPTRAGQDLFVLSKGHAVAALASIYAELGYFDRSVLRNSRSYASILNGHPGPVLPGIQIATGPMGQGLSVAQGFALAGRVSPRFDTYALCGDGEMQEGPIWEAVMFAGQKHLDNLCVMIDRNNGQLDLSNRMIFPMPDLEAVFRSFNWEVHSVDATQYNGLYAALEQFRFGPRNGKPTAIVCHGTKGHGALSDFLNKHKVTVPDRLLEQEMSLQAAQRQDRADEFIRFHDDLRDYPDGGLLQESLVDMAGDMRLDVQRAASGSLSVSQVIGPVTTSRVPPRDKRIQYDATSLPRLDPAKEYAASDVVTLAMKVFARDPRVVSIDADLATTSGLEAGVAAVDQRRALNVGVAEANMMGIGEAFAALGGNAWISTFCPFFDWKVLRRIAVGHQERLEAMAEGGWLSDGHGLDLTMLATGANFETRTNGATHMGNDDNLTFDAMAHLKIIDVSCPQQMLGVMRWVMEGNRGLLYVRVMRTPSAVLYAGDYEFAFGKGSFVHGSRDHDAVIVSSGRGVHEAIAAAREASGVRIAVVDMPSIDEDLLMELCSSGKPVCLAEQNNGYILQNLLKVQYHRRHTQTQNALQAVLAINTLSGAGRPQFIHSGTYEELIEAFGLTPSRIANAITRALTQ